MIMSKHEVILGKLQAGENFGFFIPDNRDEFGGDFFVNKKNFGWAKDGDLVKVIEIKATWKKLSSIYGNLINCYIFSKYNCKLDYWCYDY